MQVFSVGEEGDASICSRRRLLLVGIVGEGKFVMHLNAFKTVF